MTVVMVLPSIAHAYTHQCLATLDPTILHPDDLPGPPSGYQRDPLVCGVTSRNWVEDGRGPARPEVYSFVVWNSPEHNLGVGGSWNRGVAEVLRTGADWLWVLSAGVRFGKQGARDWLRFLNEAGRAFPRPWVIEAAGGLGWHCIAFHHDALELVGGFDPIFFPAYFEDNDWSYRYQLATGRDSRDPAFQGPLWPKVDIDARLPEVAHGIIRSGVEVDFAHLELLYRKKWGGVSPHEAWTRPYNDPELDWRHVGPPRVAA